MGDVVSDLVKNGKYLKWSFGIVCWEMLTLGERPYDEFEGDLEQVMRFLDSGERLTLPEWTPIPLRAILLECWNKMVGDCEKKTNV